MSAQVDIDGTGTSTRPEVQQTGREHDKTGGGSQINLWDEHDPAVNATTKKRAHDRKSD